MLRDELAAHNLAMSYKARLAALERWRLATRAENGLCV